MMFHGNKVVLTKYDVWSAIKNANKNDLVVFSSFTEETHAETCYGFQDADYPLMCANSRWDIGENYKRINEEHEYFLVVAINTE